MNALRTTILLAAMTALFMGVGFVIGGESGMLIAFGIAVLTNVFAFWNSDKMVLSMQGAREVDPRRAPELYAMTKQLADNAGLPMPKLYLMETDQPNAFATGRNPQNAAVAVTTGLLRSLDPDEVAGVVAHELAHIKNRDTLIMTITATLAGAISMLAQFGLFFGGRNSNSPIGPLATIAMVILAPIAAMLVQMAISRTREYQADRDGAAISGDPRALAGALQKISTAARRIPNMAAERNPAAAHMYIANPLSGERMDNLFSTHPDVNNRIQALMAMASEPMPVRAPAGFGDRPAARRAPPPANAPRGGGQSWRTPGTGRRRDSDGGPWS